MKAYFVVGLSFGDEGKGSIVDSLVRETKADLVVRFNGGAQAAHHVVTNDGREHCFAQFGSGTLAGARTHLSKYMMIDPYALRNEATHLQEIGISNPFGHLTVDPDAPIITPYHVALNRLRETLRGDQRHGSCGRGIGELGSDIANHKEVLTMGQLIGPKRYAVTTLENIRDQIFQEAYALDPLWHVTPHGLRSPTETVNEMFEKCYLVQLAEMPKAETLIFEGAQGVLLDECYGFHPHTTWSNCTFDNAVNLLPDNCHEVVKIGVTRCYATRHGAGPLPTEDHIGLTTAGCEHNRYNEWQGNFRGGHLDLVLLDYAISVLGGIDQLALTCVDQMKSYKVAIKYDERRYLPLQKEKPFPNVDKITYINIDHVPDLCTLLEAWLPTSVGIVSSGPTAKDKEYDLCYQD